MRELTLLESGYFAGVVLLSLLLPLLMSVRGSREASARKACLKIVWIGQALAAVAGLAVLGSASVAPYAFAFATITCVCCAVMIVRQFSKALSH